MNRTPIFFFEGEVQKCKSAVSGVSWKKIPPEHSRPPLSPFSLDGGNLLLWYGVVTVPLLKYSPTSTQAIKMLGRRYVPLAVHSAALRCAWRFKADHSVLKTALTPLMPLTRREGFAKKAAHVAVSEETSMPAFNFANATLAALPLTHGLEIKVCNSLYKDGTCVLVAHAVETDADAAAVAAGCGGNVAKAKDSSLLVFVPPTLEVDVRSARGVTQLVVGEQLPGSTPTKCSEADSWSVYVVEDFENAQMMEGAVRMFCKALRTLLPHTSLREYLLYRHPTHYKVRCVRGREIDVCVAATFREWRALNDRHVKLFVDQPLKYYDNTCSTWETTAHKDVIRFATDNPHVTQLVGGESGSGKTMLMLGGRSDEVDLVVYVKLPLEPADDEHALWEAFRTVPDGKFQERGDAFVALVVRLVTVRLQQSGEDVNRLIRASGSENERSNEYRVRFAFDEAGSQVQFVRVLCSVSAGRIRKALGWPANVKVHAVIGGTGVGSERSSVERYQRCHLTVLQPSSSVWGKMRKEVLAASRLELESDNFAATLRDVLDAVDADFVCKGAVANPRLAVLIATECWKRAKMISEHFIFKMMHSADICTQVLLPAALAFKALNGLSTMAKGDTTRRTLVAALRHALLPHHCEDANFPIDTLERKYGVLVDNAYFKFRCDFRDNTETIIVDENGNEPIDPLAPKRAPAAGRYAKPIIDPDAVACYPTLKGRYSISPAMVAVLYSLLMGNSSSLIIDCGDKFEVAVAQMMYIVMQVYEGRPVAELLQCLFGSDIVASNDMPKTAGDAIVGWRRLELRYNRAALNMDHYWSDGAGGDRARILVRRELWRQAEGTAWVEVSAKNLPSADVVVHIPGVVTIAVQCSDVSSMNRETVDDSFDGMVVRSPHLKNTHEVLANKLAALSSRFIGGRRTPVVPVLCCSRNDMLSAAYKREAHTNGILVDGYGEEDSGDAQVRSLVGKGVALREAQRRIAIRKTRRSTLPFSLGVANDAAEVVDCVESEAAGPAEL